MRNRWLGVAVLVVLCGVLSAAEKPVGVVSHVKVLSDKVRDVSSLEAWKKSFITDGMTDGQKALAVWKSTVMFRYQDAPPLEFLHEGCVHDPIKTFNVYGYGMCCCAASNVEALARYVGLEARGWALNAHNVPEVYYDGAWHLLDASLVNYFPKADGTLASVAEIVAAVKGWLDQHPKYRSKDAQLRQFQQAEGWMGWKKGPELLAHCPFYDWSGWWPAKTHGWYSTMQEYDGTGGRPFLQENGYSQGYQVNIELRPGERLTRNWFHKGRHVNGILNDGGAPGCLSSRIGEGNMAYLTGYGDLNRERVGSGTLEYEVPLADNTFRSGALEVDNLAARAEDGKGPAVHVKDAAQPGVLELRLPTSYVYLGGELTFQAVAGEGGKVRVFSSDNNGLDWKEVVSVERSGAQKVDLGKFILRHYDYRLRFVLHGPGTGLESLKIATAIQCSQRALPTLTKGDNTITFHAGPDEGTITIEGTSTEDNQGKNVTLADFHPKLTNVDPTHYLVKKTPAEVVFPIATPGVMTRLRLGASFRIRDKADRWEVEISTDGGKTFRKVDTYAGPTQGKCQYTAVSDLPAGTREALVRWRCGAAHNATCLFLVRIDADYRQPHGGFRPVKVTYIWEEGGLEKRDVHVAMRSDEKYRITCASRPVMKSIVLELADGSSAK